MYVHGNTAWPTITWLRENLRGVEGENISWGVEREGVFGGSPKVYGYRQLQMLHDAGVPVPEHTDDYATALEWQRAGGTLFARKHNHAQGKDIILVKPRPALFPRRGRMRHYWVRVIETIPTGATNQGNMEETQEVCHEYRIHSFKTAEGFRTIGVGAKKRTAKPMHRIREGLENVRSRRNGWRMYLNIPAPKGLRPLAHKATAALGYDFGAVDILDCGPEAPERFVVLEVNSAPALLSEHTRARYLTAIKERR